MIYIKKYIVLFFISMHILKAMEYPDNSNQFEELIFDCKESALDRKSNNKLSLAQGIKQSIKTEKQRQLLQIAIEYGQTANWQMLPEELILHIFSFIPYSMKHIMLINKRSKSLTEDQIFLQALANSLVKENLQNAIQKFGHAIETENLALTKAFLKAHILEKIIEQEGPENSTVQSFANSVLRLSPKIAHKIFVKSAQKNNTELIILFLNAGIDIDNAYNSVGNNALMEAAACGKQEAVLLLIEHNANIDAQNKYGYAPIHFAVRNERCDMVEFLCNQHANLEIQTKILQTTPLILAAKLGYLSIVRLLIEHHADVNAKEATSHTALIHTAMNGHYDVVKYLLDNNANARVKTKNPKKWYSFSSKELTNSNACYGYTALMYACEQGHEMVAEELLKSSDINAKNDDGFTALECVFNKYSSKLNSEIAKFQKIIDLLLCNGAWKPTGKSKFLIF